MSSPNTRPAGRGISSMDFQIDNLTIILLFSLSILAIYLRFFSTPTPLVHPLLLGKQSDVSSVRKPGETGVYRSFATGQGSPLTVRPANGLKTVSDIIPKPNPLVQATQRNILETQVSTSTEGYSPSSAEDKQLTDEALTEIIRVFRLGFKSLFPALTRSPSATTPIVALLPPSPSTALPLLLAQLAIPPSTPLIILSNPVQLSAALTSTSHRQPVLAVVHASLLDDLLEQIWEDRGDQCGVCVVGDPEKERFKLVENAKTRGMKVGWWEEVWEAAENVSGTRAETVVLPDAHIYDVHSYFYLPSPPDSAPVVVKVNHLNTTAGIAGLLSLFPADKRPSGALRDVVASSVRLDTPLGMTIALASVWSGAGFRMIGRPDATWPSETEEEDQAAQLEALADGDKPTILFISSKHHSALLSRLHHTFSMPGLTSFAGSHKLSSIRGGHISRDGLWDKYVLSRMRENTLGGVAGERLRAVIVVGDAPPADSLGLSHLLTSLPLTRLHPSPHSTGPIFVTHFYDLQSPVPDLTLKFGSDKAHCGPPASNIEVVLKGDAVEGEEGGQAALKGRIWVRGPSVLERVDGTGTNDGWTDIGEEARVQTNGTFIVG